MKLVVFNNCKENINAYQLLVTGICHLKMISMQVFNEIKHLGLKLVKWDSISAQSGALVVIFS